MIQVVVCVVTFAVVIISNANIIIIFCVLYLQLSALKTTCSTPSSSTKMFFESVQTYAKFKTPTSYQKLK